jgi:hypothetical protein
MAAHIVEIARKEGTEFRSVRLALEDDGAINMDPQDIGPHRQPNLGRRRLRILGSRAAGFGVQARLRTVAREVRGPVGRGGCIPGLVQDARVEHEFDSWI